MRIALVVPGGVDRSGEYRVVPALLALLQRLSRVHDVQVIALTQEACAGEWRLGDARIHNMGHPLPAVRAIAAIYRMHRLTPFDLVHAIWSGTGGAVTVMVGKALRIPSLIHIAGGELVSLPDIGYGAAQTRLGRIRERWSLNHAAAVSAASQPVIAMLAGRCITASRIPLGVDLSCWPPRSPIRRDTTRPARLIHVASLNRVKDQTTLLRALAALRESGTRFEMDIAGEDTLQGKMQALSQQLGLKSLVRFHGFLTQRQLRPFIEAADLLVVSSRHETGPLVVLEAAIAGVPTVGTLVGHLAEWAPTAALAVPTGDWGALAAAVCQLIDDEDLRLSVAKQALKRASNEDADRTAQLFGELYAQLATARR